MLISDKTRKTTYSAPHALRVGKKLSLARSHFLSTPRQARLLELNWAVLNQHSFY